MPGAAGHVFDGVALGNHGGSFLHTGDDQLAVVGDKGNGTAGGRDVHDLPVADIFKDVNDLILAVLILNGDGVELGALAGDEVAVLVDAVQAVVGEGQLHQLALLLAVLDDGGKVRGVQAVVAPCVDGAVLHEDSCDLIARDQLANLRSVDGVVAHQLLGLLPGGGDHGAVPTVLAVVVSAPRVDMTVLGNGDRVVSTCCRVDDLGILHFVRDVQGVQLGVLGVGVVAPSIHVAVGADTDGEGSAGGNVHRAVLHIVGQLHQAHGGSDVHVEHLTAGLRQVNRRKDGSDKHEQEHADEDHQRNDRQRIPEEALDRQLSGTVIALVRKGILLGSAKKHPLQPAPWGKALGGSILFAHCSFLLYLLTRTRGSAMP